MAVKRMEAGTKLILQVETGVNAKGAATYSLRTFANINPELADADALQIGTALGALQKHASVSEIPAGTRYVVCHRDLAERAENSAPKAKIVTITDFMEASSLKYLLSSSSRKLFSVCCSMGVDTTSQVGASVLFFCYDTVKIAILLVAVIFIIGYIQSYFPPERTKRLLGHLHGSLAVWAAFQLFRSLWWPGSWLE